MGLGLEGADSLAVFSDAAHRGGAEVQRGVGLVDDRRAEQGFDDILKCDDALGPAVFVDHKEEVLVAAQELFEERGEGFSLGDDVDRASDLAELDVVAPGEREFHDTVAEHEAGGVVERAGVDGDA